MARLDKRIDEIVREQGLAGPASDLVYLKPGWRLDDAHCFGEDTKKAVTETLKRVVPCDCGECREALSTAP